MNDNTLFATLAAQLSTEGLEALNLALRFIAGIKEEMLPDQQSSLTQGKTDNAKANSKAQSFRRWLVRQIYEPELRAELVDRIVNLYTSGQASVSEIKETINKARTLKRAFVNSDGMKGKQSMWLTIGAWCKSKYISAGWGWDKTTPRLEPAPAKLRSVEEIVEERLEKERL